MSFFTKTKIAVVSAVSIAWGLMSSLYQDSGFETEDFLSQTRDAAVLSLGALALYNAATSERAQTVYTAAYNSLPSRERVSEMASNALETVSSYVPRRAKAD